MEGVIALTPSGDISKSKQLENDSGIEQTYMHIPYES